VKAQVPIGNHGATCLRLGQCRETTGIAFSTS
jgi:hypothetical protein